MNTFYGLPIGTPADFNPWASLVILAGGGVMAFGLALSLSNRDSASSAVIVPGRFWQF